ncbi:hypothetical protein QBC33DRAFT_187570 [Phialemonium atrogriseum]|uniref:Uncharacterized protein n=1 Tax=Phialemonium atrogriseum TaxID=1093897 RepID=A0AAJ0FIY9_9PEZI|nr:uncharacterized protein QBC33DRAFT_187570 [Phialemonium atrogriseum]KAK1764878.1 hypothetical protein QBC33DRAFT_187570 [Phialemonium atrogriseum]
MSQATESNLPFTSPQPKVGDPPLGWDDFKKPKLGRFPGSGDDISLQAHLGGGLDGLVIKARIKGQKDPLAVKIVGWPSRRN